MYQPKHSSQSDPLIAAAIDGLVAGSFMGLSSRDIAARAGVSASAINRRYGSQARLVLAAFEHALTDRQTHTEGLVDSCRDLALPKEDAAHLFAVMLQDACYARSDLLLLGWQIPFLTEEVDPNGHIRRDWHLAALAPWQAAGAVCGFSELESELVGTALGAMARGQLITSRPLLVQGWTLDAARRLVQRLTGTPPIPAGDSHWRLALKKHAETMTAPVLEEGSVKANIITAAIQLVLQHGPFALTHRLIAEKAGVSLSSMTYHFSGIDEILWQTVVAMIAGRSSARRETPADRMTLERLTGILGDGAADTIPFMRRLSEVELVSRYRPELAELSDTLLLRHGATSEQHLRDLFGQEAGADRLDGVNWHHLMVGLMETAATLPGPERAAYIATRIKRWARALVGEPVA